MTKKKRHILNSIKTIGFVQIITALSGLISTMLWARYLPAETFGEYRLVFSIMNFISTFCLMGTAQTAAMSASIDKDGTYLLLVKRKIKANILGTLGLTLSAIYFANIDINISLSKALISAAIIFPAYNLSTIWMSWMNGKTAFKQLAFSRIISSFLALSTICIIIALDVSSIWIIILSWLSAQAVLNGILLRALKQKLTNKDIDYQALTYGKHANISLMFNCLLSLDMLVINHFNTPTEVAIYAITLQFPDKLKMIFSVLSQVISPYLYRAKTLQERWEFLRKFLFLIWLGMAGIGLIGFIILEPISNYLFTERYTEAATYGKWLWLVMSITGPAVFLNIALQASKHPTYTYIPSVGNPCLSLMLFFFFAQAGVEGIITARIIALVLFAMIFIGAFAHRLHTEKQLLNEME